MAPLSLLDALADVPDPRSRQGRRPPVLAILSLVVLALLRGCKGPTAIAPFGRDHGVALAHALGFLRGKTPAPSCLSERLSRLDAAAFEAALSRWVASRTPAPTPDSDKQSVSLDGKTLPGSRDGEAPGHPLVAAYAHEHQAVLAPIRVNAKTNEHQAARELLGMLPVQGRVVLGDALFCQRDLCEKITEPGGDYLFTVKGNQRGLERDIAAGFGFEAGREASRRLFPPEPLPGPGPERAPTRVEKGHGRVEKRIVRTTSILTLHPKGPGLAQGIEITRERTIPGKTTGEVEYARTSLQPEEADASRWSGRVREHGGSGMRCTTCAT